MEQKVTTPTRIYKARLFEMIFSQKKECLSLYNAVNQTNYTDPEQLEINTLENALYMSMKNDVSFVIDARLSLYEHQSTRNPNLPLRFLIYVANLYSNMVKDRNLYGERLIPLPTPHFLIFYNGEENLPEREVLCLSDAYEVEEKEHSLELTATLININPGYNQALKDACQALADYSEYTARVRENAKTLPIAEAVEEAIDSCIREGILTDFLKQNRAEAISMSIFEYDEEKHMQMEREENLERGRAEGRAEGITNTLLQNIKSLMKTMDWSAEEAMDKMQVSEPDRETVRPLL